MTRLFGWCIRTSWRITRSRASASADQQTCAAILENYPAGIGQIVETPTLQSHEATAWAMSPAYTVIQIQESANDATVVSKLRYPDGSDWLMIALVEIKDGLLYRQTSYFAQSFDAPEWRARWVETIPHA